VCPVPFGRPFGQIENPGRLFQGQSGKIVKFDHIRLHLKSRNEKTSEDYFLAGRGLKWRLIGFSLIAANISSEQLVGMSGNAASHVGPAMETLSESDQAAVEEDYRAQEQALLLYIRTDWR
jgi:Sodium:solute symporter family